MYYLFYYLLFDYQKLDKRQNIHDVSLGRQSILFFYCGLSNKHTETLLQKNISLKANIRKCSFYILDQIQLTCSLKHVVKFPFLFNTGLYYKEIIQQNSEFTNI